MVVGREILVYSPRHRHPMDLRRGSGRLYRSHDRDRIALRASRLERRVL